MRTVFIGTAPFGFPVLRALSEREDVELAGVLTRPDRKRGRGQESQPPPVAEFARELNVSVFQPEDINRDGRTVIRELGPLDLGILIAYGQFLDPGVFNEPRHGTVNFHASLLPRWRGATPIRHALLEGDEVTGVTVFKLAEGMDTGPICWQESTTIGPDETYGELYERLAELNVEALKGFLDALQSGELECRPQKGEATYARRLDSDAPEIDWSRPAEVVERHVRAFCPDPGAFTSLHGERLKIYRARVASDAPSGDPGRVVRRTNDRLVIATGAGGVDLLEVQPAGSRRMNVPSFLAGHSELEEGVRLGSEA